MIARHLTNSDKMITMTEEDDDVDQGSSLLIDEDANHIDDDDSGTLQETRREVAELRDSLTYLTHQVDSSVHSIAYLSESILGLSHSAGFACARMSV
jgi:hypothetical protein